jgi:hypothetical protein
MRNYAASGLALWALVAAAPLACDRSDAPDIPLDQRGAAAGAMVPTITGEAKATLDSGNALFRARDYARALEQYRTSARLAPTELAPLLGMVMVAEATSNAALRDSTMQRIRALDPEAADSAAASPHSDIIRAHPPLP